ncbi:MAG: DUF2817 domain-containing protein, partial [Rhizomicrobium sp.]
MPNNPEPNSHTDYRTARKAFIAACETAHADPISRVHPKLSGPDGKPLFIDSVALGPRTAKKAVLLIGDGAAASAAMTALLRGGINLPADARLVMVHAFDPFSFAGASGQDRPWSRAMLRAIATEDLAQVTELTVLTLGLSEDDLSDSLMPRRPGIRLALKQIDAETGV